MNRLVGPSEELMRTSPRSFVGVRLINLDVKPANGKYADAQKNHNRFRRHEPQHSSSPDELDMSVAGRSLRLDS